MLGAKVSEAVSQGIQQAFQAGGLPIVTASKHTNTSALPPMASEHATEESARAMLSSSGDEAHETSETSALPPMASEHATEESARAMLSSSGDEAHETSETDESDEADETNAHDEQLEDVEESGEFEEVEKVLLTSRTGPDAHHLTHRRPHSPEEF
jgi:hypothetical protein